MHFFYSKIECFILIYHELYIMFYRIYLRYGYVLNKPKTQLYPPFKKLMVNVL